MEPRSGTRGLRRGVGIALLGVLGACQTGARVPLSSSDSARVDTAVAGLWMAHPEGRERPLLVLAFNEREYLLEWLPPLSEPGERRRGRSPKDNVVDAKRYRILADPAVFAGATVRERAFTTEVGGARFWNRQQVAGAPEGRSYQFTRFEIQSGGDLLLRDLWVPPALADTATSAQLHAWLAAHLPVDSLFSEARRFRRVRPDVGASGHE